MAVKLAPPGFAAEDVRIGHMVCLDDNGKYATMRSDTKGTPYGVAPKDITKGQLFRPILSIVPPVIVICGENKETDQ